MPTAKKQKKKRTKEEIAEASPISSLKFYRLKYNVDPNKPVQKKVSRKGETEKQRKARLANDRQETRAKQREEEEQKMNNAPGTPGFAGYIPGQANFQDCMPGGKANFSRIKFAPNQSFGATNLNHGNGFGATNFNTTQHNAQGGQNLFSRHSSQGPPLHQILQTQAIMVLLDRRHLAAILVLASQNSNQFSGQTGGFQTPHGQSTVAHAGSDVLIATAGSNPLVFDFLAKQMERPQPAANSPSERPTPSQLFSTPSWSNPAGSARGGDGNTTVPMEEDQEDQAGAKRFTGAPPVFNNGNLKPSNTRGRP
ncbi:unnamed protein product [Cylindrotheca closterium]|uniref:Uncharacterized protein n=1 Tax=Cylindrotheca closterium TaxID=2856 RepID=A0AAD2CNZ9_9STRA|nr:unnamed protein product [Cylindrotheca closterium]